MILLYPYSGDCCCIFHMLARIDLDSPVRSWSQPPVKLSTIAWYFPTSLLQICTWQTGFVLSNSHSVRYTPTCCCDVSLHQYLILYSTLPTYSVKGHLAVDTGYLTCFFNRMTWFYDYKFASQKLLQIQHMQLISIFLFVLLNSRKKYRLLFLRDFYIEIKSICQMIN